MKKIAKARVNELLQTLATQANVFTPVAEDGVTSFRQWSPEVKVELEGDNSVLPPKSILFPQSETMYNYHAQGLDVELTTPEPDTRQQVIFGIHPCDVKSVQLLDQIMLTKGYEDTFYGDKRQRTLLVAMGCSTARETCFCTSVGIDPAQAAAADVMMWASGDSYLLTAQTEAGQKLLDQAGTLLADAVDQPPAAPTLDLKVDLEGVTAKLQGMFEHDFWNKIHRQCIGCGACTYLCPTCHCFDISNTNYGDEGHRFRCWDSCMFSLYTLMAGGHNPRTSRKERFRQRFLHKLQYIPERYQAWGCVGCGRCLQKCPVNVDITRIIQQVKEVALDA